MPVNDYSTTPSENIALGTINLSEGQMMAADVNQAFQQIMADVKVAINAVPDVATLMPKTGGAFTGDITRQGRGGFLHYASSTLLSGRVYTKPIGAADPTGLQDGDLIIEY